MATEIRHVNADDFLPWARTMRTTFLVEQNEPTEARQAFIKRHWGDPRRRFGAYDGDRCVATLATFPTTLTVPFGDRTAEVAADALTMVTVAATHRRRGLLTTMLTRSLTDAKERGEPISILRAAEYPIYGRFGYWPASSAAQFKVDSASRPRLLADPGNVTVIQVEPADLVKPGQAVYDEARLVEHGHIARDPDQDWARALGLEGLDPEYGKVPACIVARDDQGSPVGYLIWTPAAFDGDWFAGKAPINVHQFMSTTPQAYAALWHYLLGMDLVGEIRMEERPVDEPLEHLLSDGRAAQAHRIYDATWVRLLDIPAALSARRYATTDRLVFEVVDKDGGFASGRFALDSGPDGASCVQAPGATPDLRMSQRALAGLYLSGRTVRSQRLAGLIDEETPGACARLQALLFHERAPFNATPF
jgi:predicted acetyltransferase